MTQPADLARLPAHREWCAIDTISRNIVWHKDVIKDAESVLAALRDAGFIVLHEDDVTVEERDDLQHLGTGQFRLVTEWRRDA